MWITLNPSAKILQGYFGRDQQMPAHFNELAIQMRQVGKKLGQQVPHTYTAVKILLTTVRTKIAGSGKLSITIFAAAFRCLFLERFVCIFHNSLLSVTAKK